MADFAQQATRVDFRKVASEILALGTVAELAYEEADGQIVRRERAGFVSRTIERPWRDICGQITEIFSGPLHSGPTWVEIYEIGGPAPYRYAIKFAIDRDDAQIWLVG